MCRLIAGYWRVPWQLDQFERCPFVADCSGVDPTDGRRKVFGVNGTETNAVLPMVVLWVQPGYCAAVAVLDIIVMQMCVPNVHQAVHRCVLLHWL